MHNGYRSMGLGTQWDLFISSGGPGGGGAHSPTHFGKSFYPNIGVGVQEFLTSLYLYEFNTPDKIFRQANKMGAPESLPE